jgi:hypothetical protein
MPRWPVNEEDYQAQWIARIRAGCIVSPSGCWEWQGWKTNWGYAETAYHGKPTRIHRQMYIIIHKVMLTREQYVCHTCDVRHCVNPDHLWVGTNSDNQRDSSQKARHYESRRDCCEHGHEYTPENTSLKKCRPGQISRACKRCQLIRQRVKAGWTKEEAEAMPLVPAGRRTERGNFGRMVRMRTRAEEIAFQQSLLPEVVK